MVGFGMDQLDNPFKAIIHVPLRLLRKAAEIPLSKKRGGSCFEMQPSGIHRKKTTPLTHPSILTTQMKDVDVDY
jgi:hypothetical protein